MPTLHRTIVRPLITEKSSAAYQDRGEYTFEVHPDATKPQIRSAIEQLFGVKVTVGHRPNWKKAIVTLRDGDTIEIFEG
jgi:large subunit ribosomal protein L23